MRLIPLICYLSIKIGLLRGVYNGGNKANYVKDIDVDSTRSLKIKSAKFKDLVLLKKLGISFLTLGAKLTFIKLR